MKPLLLKTEWKAWDFLISIKKSDKDKDFKNTEIQLVFPASPFFCCHIGWGTQWLCPKAPSANTVPLFLQWHSAARRWNPWTNIRDLFLPERAEKQQTISIFILSHSFYFFSSSVHIVHLTQAMFSKIVIFVSSCIMRSYLWYKRLRHCMTCFTCMRSSKTAVCLHFHTLLSCIFL